MLVRVKATTQLNQVFRYLPSLLLPNGTPEDRALLERDLGMLLTKIEPLAGQQIGFHELTESVSRALEGADSPEIARLHAATITSFLCEFDTGR